MQRGEEGRWQSTAGLLGFVEVEVNPDGTGWQHTTGVDRVPKKADLVGFAVAGLRGVDQGD